MRLHSKKLLQIALAAAISFGGATPAYAQRAHATPVAEELPPAAAESERQTRFYGWQTGLVDGAALGLFTAGLATMKLCVLSPCNNSTSESFLALSLATYAFGAPTVHGAHGRWGTAGASFGLRMAPIVVGAPLLAADEGSGGAVLFGGAIIAMIVDSTVLAREPVRPAAAKVQVTPVVDPQRRTGFVLVTRDF